MSDLSGAARRLRTHRDVWGPTARDAGDVAVSGVQSGGVAPGPAAFVAAARARGLSARTLEAYTWALSKLPEDTSTEGLELALGSLTGLGSVSRRDVWRRWRTYYRWRVRRYGAPDPTAVIAPPRVRPRLPLALDWPTTQEVVRGAATRRDRVLLLLLLDTGLRIGEVAGLRPEDLQQDGVGRWTLRVVGKVGERQVPVSREVVQQLTGLLPWSVTLWGVKRAIIRCMRRAGVTRGSCHALRHTFAKHYLVRGGDLFSLQAILGHQDIKSTRIYVELARSDVARQHAQFSPALALLAGA